MSTTKLAVGWIRERWEAQDLVRAVRREKRTAGAAIDADGTDDRQLSVSQTGTPGSRLLGAHGGLDRILMAVMRQLNQCPSSRANSRASADRLYETIRVLSVL